MSALSTHHVNVVVSAFGYDAQCSCGWVGGVHPHDRAYTQLAADFHLVGARLDELQTTHRELAAALESSEVRRDAACRGNVRLAAELEKATKRIAELEAELTATRLAFVESPSCYPPGD